MEITHNFNFNDPIEATRVFRYRDDKGKVTGEYSSKVAFGWEDLSYIESYPFNEEWEKFKGEKYTVKLRGQEDLFLLLGDYDSMLRYWIQFRNTYPLFTNQDGMDNRED